MEFKFPALSFVSYQLHVSTPFPVSRVSFSLASTYNVNCFSYLAFTLNKYETDPYFLHLFQSITTVCLIIHGFFKSCELEIVFVLICTLAEQFHVCKSYKMQESTLLCVGNFEENGDLSHIYLAVQVVFISLIVYFVILDCSHM